MCTGNDDDDDKWWRQW